MQEDFQKDHPQESPSLDDEGKVVSRREFLKIAGVAGAAVGMAGGLGGILAACGGEETTTTSAAPATTATTAPPTTATTAGSTTTVSAGPETGRDIILGLVSPKTGPLAEFAKADDWWVDFALKAVPDGIIAGDGKKHMIKIERADSQSDVQRASQVAGDLFNNAKVDLMMASGSPDTANPVADACEALGCPSIANFVPWQPFFFGRQKDPANPLPFKWTYAHALGLEQIVANFIAMWEQLETNKKIGFLFANDADGAAWTDKKTGLPPAVEAAGYTYVEPGLYTVGTEDFTTQIQEFKKQGCEICCGTIITPDFTSFWKQATQQGYKPKFVTIGKALLFPQTLDAIGPIAYNTTVECVWHPTWPFKDSITGKTCQELAEDFMAKTGGEWTAPIGQYGKFEWAVDVFKRVKNIDDKNEIIEKVSTTKLETCLGPMDFTAPVQMGTRHPVPNVCTPPIGGAQWVKSDRFAFEPVIVSNALSPELPVAAKVQPMQYS
jgi:branched-chain amino acid transport system substrate-binding protein